MELKGLVARNVRSVEQTPAARSFAGFNLLLFRNPFLLGIAGIAPLAVAPLFLSIFHLMLLADAISLGILALSAGLLFGFVGLLSFGQAAFYGLAGYMIGITVMIFNSPLWLGIILALAVPPAVGYMVGFLSTRRRGIYFVMITLAAGEVIHQYFFYTTFNVPGRGIMGGANGFQGIPVPMSPWDWVRVIYYVTIVLLVFVLIFAKKLVDSPFGSILKGIRENELRMRFLGYDVERYKVFAFTAASFIAAISGLVFTLLHQVAGPDMMEWIVSGEAIAAVFIGGSANLMGPVVGGIILMYVIDRISRLTIAYLAIIGAMVIAIILFMPRGVLVSGWLILSKRIYRHKNTQ